MLATCQAALEISTVCSFSRSLPTVKLFHANLENRPQQDSKILKRSRQRQRQCLTITLLAETFHFFKVTLKKSQRVLVSVKRINFMFQTYHFDA